MEELRRRGEGCPAPSSRLRRHMGAYLRNGSYLADLSCVPDCCNVYFESPHALYTQNILIISSNYESIARHRNDLRVFLY